MSDAGFIAHMEFQLNTIQRITETADIDNYVERHLRFN